MWAKLNIYVFKTKKPVHFIEQVIVNEHMLAV